MFMMYWVSRYRGTPNHGAVYFTPVHDGSLLKGGTVSDCLMMVPPFNFDCDDPYRK